MDIAYLLLLQSFREATGGFLNAFLTFITTIAVDYYVVLPALIIFWVFDKKKGAQVALSYGTGCFYNAILKTTFCIYRPWIRDSRVKPLDAALPGATGYSFPSGHSTSAGGFYGGIIFTFKKYRGICVFAASMILLTMFSRNYVGVHTPQDVLVGASLGLFAAFTASRVLGWVENHPDKDWMVWLIAVGACTAVLVYIHFKPYPMDYVDGQLLVDPKKMTVDGFKDPGVFMGLLTGWLLERRYVRFELKGETHQKVLICLVGCLLYVFWESAVVGPVGKAAGVGLVHFALKMSTPLLAMTLYPSVCQKLLTGKNK